MAFCNRRGGSWWRPVPRIGAGRARHIVAWLRQHEASNGEGVFDDVELEDALVSADLAVVDGPRSALVPLEWMTVSAALSGTTGANRSNAFSFIQARNGLDAARAYLNRYRDQAKTLRVYTELKRFLLWAVALRGKPMSALMVEDREAYKDFLAPPPLPLSGLGRRAPRRAGALSRPTHSHQSRSVMRHGCYVRVRVAGRCPISDRQPVDGLERSAGGKTGGQHPHRPGTSRRSKGARSGVRGPGMQTRRREAVAHRSRPATAHGGLWAKTGRDGRRDACPAGGFTSQHTCASGLATDRGRQVKPGAHGPGQPRYGVRVARPLARQRRTF
ncbi:hypothetical protein OH764_34395 (plasmid) [Burkholderia sp. M6-3]